MQLGFFAMPWWPTAALISGTVLAINDQFELASFVFVCSTVGAGISGVLTNSFRDKLVERVKIEEAEDQAVKAKILSLVEDE